MSWLAFENDGAGAPAFVPSSVYGVSVSVPSTLTEPTGGDGGGGPG